MPSKPEREDVDNRKGSAQDPYVSGSYRSPESEEWSGRVAGWAFLLAIVTVLVAVAWSYAKAAGIPLP